MSFWLYTYREQSTSRGAGTRLFYCMNVLCRYQIESAPTSWKSKLPRQCPLPNTAAATPWPRPSSQELEGTPSNQERPKRKRFDNDSNSPGSYDKVPRQPSALAVSLSLWTMEKSLAAVCKCPHGHILKTLIFYAKMLCFEISLETVWTHSVP